MIKNKTWTKIGDVLLDYSKIFIAIGIITPFVNKKSIDNPSLYGIIILVIIFIVTGLITYNKGVENE